MTMPTPDEIQRIAAAMNAVRPTWRTTSLVTFLSKHHTNRPYRDLAIAAVVVATDPRTETPELLNRHGAWWSAAQAAFGSATDDLREPRCTVDGHGSYFAKNCGACHADRIATDTPDTTPVLTLTPEQRDTNLRGIRNVRAVMNREDHQ